MFNDNNDDRFIRLAQERCDEIQQRVAVTDFGEKSSCGRWFSEEANLEESRALRVELLCEGALRKSDRSFANDRYW